MTFRVRAFAPSVSLALALSFCVAAPACGDDDDAPAAPTASGDASADGNTPRRITRLSRPSRGAAIDISEDDTLVVTVNRDVGTVSVFDVVGVGLTKRAELNVCAEPWQVTLAPSGDRAFVVCRKDQSVVRLDALRSAPAKGPTVAVGSEPVSVAMTPAAKALWVSNWMDGTVMEIEPEAMTVSTTIDLNAALVATGTLGIVAPRPGLAHPRNLAITNNRDAVEIDETIFVAEFFAQQKEALDPRGLNADVARQGFVYAISLRDRSVKTIALPPIADVGLNDLAGDKVGCFPNQLQGIDVQGNFAYVLSVCESPKGPLADYTGPPPPACTDDVDCPGAAAGSCLPAPVAGGARTCATNCTDGAECGNYKGRCEANKCVPSFANARALLTSAVTVIDVGEGRVLASVALNGAYQAEFDRLGVPDTTARRFPASATDLAFVPGTLNAYVAAKGADAVYRINFNKTYETRAIDGFGSPEASKGRPFIALDDGLVEARLHGKTPIGITVAHGAAEGAAARLAYVLNESSRNVTVLDLNQEAVATAEGRNVVVESAPLPTEAAARSVLEGKRLFSNALGRWSFQGQGWVACESCHWDGLSDQTTWFQLKGPRQSPTLDQTVDKKTKRQRVLNWNAFFDELEDIEAGILRGAMGGTGAIVQSSELSPQARIPFDTNGHGGLNGSSRAAADTTSPSTLVGTTNTLEDWRHLSAYQAAIRSPRKPSNLDPAAVSAGRALFEEASCQGCHGGSHWTIADRFYEPEAANASARPPVDNLNYKLRKTAWSGVDLVAAGFPAALLPAASADDQRMRYDGPNAGLDSMTCLLRPVGTYATGETGVVVAEVRRDHATPAQGNQPAVNGYNVPSLLGVAVNAPFFHAGNARTLEGLLSDPFKSHHEALAPGFLADADANANATKRAELVQFLLSIDEDTPPLPIPAAVGSKGGTFCAPPN